MPEKRQRPRKPPLTSRLRRVPDRCPDPVPTERCSPPPVFDKNPNSKRGFFDKNPNSKRGVFDKNPNRKSPRFDKNPKIPPFGPEKAGKNPGSNAPAFGQERSAGPGSAAEAEAGLPDIVPLSSAPARKAFSGDEWRRQLPAANGFENARAVFVPPPDRPDGQPEERAQGKKQGQDLWPCPGAPDE